MGQTGAPSVSVLAPLVKLRQVVDVAGPGFHNTQAVASLLGRHTRDIINHWITKPTSEEREMLRQYFSGRMYRMKGIRFQSSGCRSTRPGETHGPFRVRVRVRIRLG